MNWTASSVASGSRAVSGSRARMVWYLGTLLTTAPPKARMRSRTAGVTSTRISTITGSGSAAGSVYAAYWRSETVGSGGCRAASRSCEITFRWAGVRCSFASSNSLI